MHLLEQLTQIIAPSGNEESVSHFISNEIADYVDDISRDCIGNLIAHKKGGGKKIMLTAHMDQIGLIATYVDEEGFVRFGNLGGVGRSAVLNSKVQFLSGAVGIVCADKTSESSTDSNKMYIDVGKAKVEVGDVAVMRGSYDVVGDFVSAPALDDRVGCYVLIEVIKRLQNSPNDLYFVFTAQEELGLRGAKTSAFAVEPELAISVDVTTAGDIPGDMPNSIKLGGGAAIKVKDSSVICHPLVKDILVNSAKELDLNYQFEVLLRGGTDAGAIHLSKGGTPCGVLSIPARYVHTSCEMVCMKDVEDAINILTHLLRRALG